MSLYSMRSLPNSGQFTITKFDDDLNVESSYEFRNAHGTYTCFCPAGQRPTCRHRQMFPMLQLRVDSPWMLDFDTRTWVDPTGEAGREQPTEVAIPQRTVLEESPPEPDKPTTLPDSHPFRRRM